MDDWMTTILGDFASLQRGHDLPEHARHPGDIPVMGSFGITGTHSESITEGPGVTVGRSGASIGVVSYIERDYWPLNTCLYVTDFHGNNPRFVYYFLKTLNLANFNSGSAQPSLNRNYIHPISIHVPRRMEQDDIAGLLGALDDKIELNRRMNETLEAMARAFFKDWFVDFGPVRAKQEGRDSYLAPGLWSLFPERLDAEGKPEGWKLGTLGDVADSPRRGISPAEVEEDTPYIGLEHMPRHSITLADWEGAGKVTSNKSRFNRGEFLFGKLRPYFHKVGIAPLDGISSTDIVVVITKATNFRSFVLAYLSSDEFVDYTSRTATGTKMPRTKWKTMAQYAIPVPPDNVACAFQDLTQPFLDQVIGNIHESRTLAQTRDMLLPKLMSGEIRVMGAEKAMEAVA